MLYKTFESDKNGKLIICPSLDPPKPGLFRRLVEFISSFSGKTRDRSGNGERADAGRM